MNKNTLRVSVIMPCHNAERWIGEALRSAAAQTQPPHEIIVIDDASTDDSHAQIAASGVPVKLLSANCRNAAAARNIGIRAATGDWIAFLDADDVWYPQHLERAAHVLQNGQDVAFMALFDLMDVNGRTKPLPKSLPITTTQKGLLHQAFLPFLTEYSPFGHSNVLYRLKRVCEVGAFDDVQMRVHDMDLFIRVIRDHTWCFDAVPHSAYRIDTPGSISKSRVSRQYFALRMLHKNQDAFAQAPKEMDILLRATARQAMSLALSTGNRDDRHKAAQLGWPYLTASFKVAYTLSRVCPSIIRSLLQLRSALKNRTEPVILRAGEESDHCDY